VRIALGAVAPTPIRAVNAEKLLVGRKADEATLAEVCDEVEREVRPITDVRASAEYRREMCRVLVRRAIQECAAGTGCSL
jgi:carbon-monoxide dehydrogenase medium subunit